MGCGASGAAHAPTEDPVAFSPIKSGPSKPVVMAPPEFHERVPATKPTVEASVKTEENPPVEAVGKGDAKEEIKTTSPLSPKKKTSLAIVGAKPQVPLLIRTGLRLTLSQTCVSCQVNFYAQESGLQDMSVNIVFEVNPNPNPPSPNTSALCMVGFRREGERGGCEC